MTNNTNSELREQLLDHFTDGAPSYATANESVQAIARAKVDGIMPMVTSAQLDLLDRLEQSINNHTTPEGRQLLTRSYVKNTLDFERGKLTQNNGGKK